MRHEAAGEEILALIEAGLEARPSPMEFEMAYQARVAIDRIRFAIKHTEQFSPNTDQMRETGLQLLDALERLETVDRRFQLRSRRAPATARLNPDTRSDSHQIFVNSESRSPQRADGRSAKQAPPQAR
ncbi:MAG: hypothetical protein JOZ62_01225 [Acidobacteriaceae bacterium]|nr:hypothetical protein [Acidobacteriaceae bacterium]